MSLVYKILYPAKTPEESATVDLVSRHLTLTADGEPIIDEDVSFDAPEREFTVEKNSLVHVDWFNLDDDGNESEHVVREFVAKDLIAPVKPPDLIITPVAET